MEGYHRSVLLREAVKALSVKKDSWYLDCTLGDGGHSLEILKRGANVVGIDVDPEAIRRAQGRLGGLGKFRLIQGNFRDIKNLILRQGQDKFVQTDLKDQKFAGAIFDLGVSSMQIETPERGFSFSKEGPLDMRMDPTLQVRALDLIKAGGRKELNELFSRLGEEKYSRRLANALVLAREVRSITTTRELAEIVERAVGRRWKIPAFAKASAGKHPATQVFQALRMAVNDELGALQEGLDQIIDLIEKNGSIVVISFHSLEDRIVKLTFREWEEQRLGQITTTKPIVPKDNEVRDNPRSRSAKMRVFTRS